MKPSKTVEPPPPMVISYLRFSSAEQIKGDSTRRQLDMSEKYAAQRGWEITKNLSDKGVSAFRGGNAANGALATLLELVRVNSIPRGSVLLVESLDRLSRNEISEALELFLGLIRSGIRIVTLGDGYEYRKGNLELSNLMYSLMVMSRAHEESATKSRRIGESWKAKRSRIDKEPLTGMVPAWLEMKDGKIVVDKDKARVVKNIFDLAIGGRGINYIVKHLNAGTPVIGQRADHWGRSYVSKILNNRAVLGEFHPHKIAHRNGKRVREPIGDPIKSYYPAVVSEQDFYAAQAGMKDRRQHHGPSSKFLNLFRGLLFDAADKSPMQIRSKGTRGYVSAAAIEGRSNHDATAFPVAAFETAFLWRVSQSTNLNLEDNRTVELNHEAKAVAGKLDAVTNRIAAINKALEDTEGDTDPAALVPTLTKLNSQRQELTAAHESIQQRIASASAGSPTEAAEKIATLMAGSMAGRMKPEVRFELQQAIAQLVDRIDCRTKRNGPCTSCAVVVTLKNKLRIEYAAKVKNLAINEVVIDTGDGETVHIEMSIPGQKSRGVSPSTEGMVKKLWRDALRPVEIAEACRVSISQVYRIAGSEARLKRWKPASRWDGHKEKRTGIHTRTVVG